ncbi:MAG: D-arabinono-1,4-lactone oxidase [Pseudomonadota bacterium]
MVTPQGVDEVVRTVRAAAASGTTLRCVGSGHSFVPFWADAMVVSLDALRGVIDVDPERYRATVAAGTRLHELGPALWAWGLSLPQQGDIDRQALAGAVATGTHGTGRRLPSLSAYVRGMTLVTAAGERLRLSAEDDPERLDAARLALGTLGVVVDVELDLAPAFHLHERVWESSVADCESELAQLIAGNRHFEFFWTPRTDRCDMKALNPVPADAPAGYGERVAPAYRVFPSERDIRFNEMEYAVPAASGWACFSELREMMLARFPKLPWPVEYRTLAADDALLAPAHGRDSVALSVHQGAERDYRPLFEAAEAVLRNHGGRPHWGKLHTLDAAGLAGLYPAFDRFRAIRAELDPRGVFLNGYLRNLFAA